MVNSNQEAEKVRKSIKSILNRWAYGSVLSTTYAVIVGALASYVIAYPLIIISALTLGLGFALSGQPFGDGFGLLDFLASRAALEEEDWNEWSGYGLFLIALNAVSIFVGSRIAGALAPGREYWAAVLVVPAMWLIYSALGYKGVETSISWMIVSEVIAILFALVGGYKARRANI